MSPEAINEKSADFYISPTTFSEYFFRCSDKAECERQSRMLFDSVACYVNIVPKFSVRLKSKDMIVICWNDDKERERDAYIIACRLPSDFFEKLNARVPNFSNSERFSIHASKIQQSYFKKLIENLYAQAFVPLINIGKPSKILNLSLDLLSIDDYMCLTNVEKPLDIAYEARKAFFKIFRKNFTMTKAFSKEATVLGLNNFRKEDVYSYEIIKYPETAFGFIKVWDRDLQKIFVQEYFSFILHNNLKQILGGE